MPLEKSQSSTYIMIGTLELRSRPLKLAWLVDPAKSTSVKQAIEMNSSLWGGCFNPIIPVYKRTPPTFEGKSKKSTYTDIIKGYIDAYDPDILVQCIPDLPDPIKEIGLEIIEPDEIWMKNDNRTIDADPSYGIGIFELYDYIFKEHFRYLEKYPPSVTIPRIPRKHSLFWSSVYGKIPQNLKKQIGSDYHKGLNITEPKVSTFNFNHLLKGKNLFPRRLTMYGLDSYKRSGWLHGDAVFFMDATKTSDIIDYWNLRALGWSVLPMPIQFKDIPEIKTHVKEFVIRSYKPLRGNPKVYTYASFIRSRNSSMDDMQKFVESLSLKDKSTSPPSGPDFVLQHWYPRIWDEWARSNDGAESNEIYFEESVTDLTEVQSQIRINFKKPEFIGKYAFHGNARVANEVSLRVYGTETNFAQVYPKTQGKNLIHAIGGIGYYRNDWRIGRSGIVKLISNEHGETWQIPESQDIFSAWFSDLGWEVKISTPGLVASQMFKQLDGLIRPLANENLIKLLDNMSKGKEGETVAEIKNRLKQLPRNPYNFLVRTNVFKLGVRVQCPTCQKNSWYNFKDLDDQLECPKCLKSFTAIGVLENGNFAYKTAGPFSIPGFADGAYCVILTLDFFKNQLLHLKITPSFSFTASNKNGNELETDYAMLWQDTAFGKNMTGVLFAECKTFGDFEQKDFERMSYIAEVFPGSVIAFCTLKKSLTKFEKSEITKIAKKGRKYWKSDRPINPVLILTGNELLNEFGPPECWDGTKFKDKFKHTTGILEVADATQEIYLELPSWSEEWYKKFEERRKRMLEKRTAEK